MKKLLLSSALLLSVIVIAQPTSWEIKGVGGGGALFLPSINPGNVNEFYVPTDMGTMFHTTNYGQTYDQLSFLQLRGGKSAVVRFTNNTNIRYAVGGSGEVFKSTDGGSSWIVIPAISGSSDPDVKQSVVSLYTNYNNPNQFVFATVDGMFFSNDGGITISDITQSSPSYQYISGCLFDGNNIYLGTPGGVVVSTNGGLNFNKITLTGLAANHDIVGFAAAKQGSTIRFVCATMPTGTSVDQIFGTPGGWQNSYVNNVYTVDYNLSTVWTPKSSGIILPTSSSCYPCHYAIWVGMANNDVNNIYLAGPNGNAQAFVLKSTDGGTTWNDSFKIIGNVNIVTGYSGYQGDLWQWYNSFDCLEVCQSNSDYVAHTSMGYIHVTSNGGTTWRQAYVNIADENPLNAPTPKHKVYNGIGIEPTSNWQATWVDANNMVFSLTDIGCLLSSNGGDGWRFTDNFTYNTMYCVLKHGSGTLYGAASNAHDMYTNYLQDKPIDNSSYSNGEIMYSTDNGVNWTTLKNFARPVYWLAFDPNNSNKMYASIVNHTQGLGGVYVTSDLNNGTSATWTKLPNPPRTEGHPAKIVVLKDGKVVCTYGPRQTDWTATPSGKFTKSAGVFIYDPGNNTWTDLTDLTSLNAISGTYTGTMGWWCNDIYVDPNDASENTWYVGVSSGWGWTDASGGLTPNDQGSLMKTTNRGQTWTPVLSESNGLPAGGGVFSCALNPNDANQMFVTTSTAGLWVSNNINAPTPTFSQVPSFSFGFPLRIFFNPYNTNEMWVSTFGNGIHVGMLPTGINESNDLISAFSLYPNPAVDAIYLSATSTIGTYSILNSIGEVVKTEAVNAFSVEVKTTELANGVYFVKIGSACKKVVVNH